MNSNGIHVNINNFLISIDKKYKNNGSGGGGGVKVRV